MSMRWSDGEISVAIGQRVQVERISGERPPSANHPGPGYFPNVFLSKGSTSPLDAMGSRISVSP